jgi:GT2 family glycosyltransferase/LmbE family N-acetylglucosaminyl deacetylase
MRLLVFAPHPDDEIIGCGGLIHQTCQDENALRVIVVTDGAAGGVAAARELESIAGLAELGAENVVFWRFQDGALPIGGEVLERIWQVVNEWGPTHIALPGPTEAHPDHRRLTRAVLNSLTSRWRGILLFYETTTPLPLVNHYEQINLPVKLEALRQHRSQLSQYDYLRHAQAMGSLRGTAQGVLAAEGFLRYEWDGSPQNFFESRPLISVIVRSDDADLLTNALTSLIAQSYDQLEVILVWHGNVAARPSLPPMLEGCVVQGPGPRSANLNAGIARAQGRYLAFLDQDDVWYSDFLAVLLAELQANPDLDIVYGDYCHAICTIEDDRLLVRPQHKVHGRDYHPGRLLAGNHIALNSFLCSTRLARRLGFDEALDAFEDWEFLARAEMQGACFQRVAQLLCEYRLYPQPGEEADLETLHSRKGYTQWRDVVLCKIFEQLKPSSMLTMAERISTLESERDAALDRADISDVSILACQQDVERLKLHLHQTNRWADLLAPASIGAPALSLLAGLAFGNPPVIAVIVPVCDPEPAHLLEAIQSVTSQTYPHWQICIADDASSNPQILAILEELSLRAGEDPRFRVARRSHRGGIVAASRDAIALADAPWLAFLDHDDRLHEDALLEIAAAIRVQPEHTAFYTDSRMMDRNGVELHSYRKPGWAPETLLHLNYINHLSIFQRDTYERLGGLRPGLDGSQDWDLWLRFSALPDATVGHIKLPLYDWRATETSVAYAPSNKPYAIQAACQSVREHLTARGLTAVQTHADASGGGLRSQWHHQPEPLCAIVLTHHNPTDLRRLIDGLVSSLYPRLEVILVANRVADTDTLAQLEQAALRPGWQVLVDDRSFNWAALNNAAARHTSAPWLLFLNDDIELPTPQTLPALTRYLALDERIAAVGARLEYGPEQGGGIQHDGVVTGLGDIHNVTDQRDGKGLGVPRNVSAVTGACLLTRRTTFAQSGGFDERFSVSFNDVDYCLHLRRLGWRVVQASDVVCIHRESRTRGPLDSEFKRQQLLSEIALMNSKWQGFLEEKYVLNYVHRYMGSRIVRIPDA